MGYDMYLRGEPSVADQEAFRLANITYEAALAERDALPKSEHGQHITEVTKARFEADPEGTKAESTAMFEDANRRADELEKQGIDFFLARQMTGEVPPSERYVEVQKRVLAASEARSVADKSYYRLNIWGMSACCDLMNTLDMLKAGTFPGWPDQTLEDDVFELLNEFGYDDGGRDTASTVEGLTKALHAAQANPESSYAKYYSGVTVTDEDIATYAKWSQEHHAALAVHDEDQPGIAVNKFSSNDGWIVTKEECASALEVWNSHAPDTKAATIAAAWYWPSWIDFLRAGAEADGFSVH